MSVFAVIVNLIPYVIAGVIAVRFAVKQKKTKCKVTWEYSPLPLSVIVINPLAYIYVILFEGAGANILSLLLLFLGYLIFGRAFFVSLTPTEYGGNLYSAFGLTFLSAIVLISGGVALLL